MNIVIIHLAREHIWYSLPFLLGSTPSGKGDHIRQWLYCLCLSGLPAPKLYLNHLVFQWFDYVRIWWRLFQKHDVSCSLNKKSTFFFIIIEVQISYVKYSTFHELLNSRFTYENIIPIDYHWQLLNVHVLFIGAT